MITGIVAATVVIAAGNIGRALQALTDTGYLMLWEHDRMKYFYSDGVRCECCTTEEAIRRILVDTPFRLVPPDRNDAHGNATLVFEPGGYCWPEMGADAPVPPCNQRPRSLVIDAERDAERYCARAPRSAPVTGSIISD